MLSGYIVVSDACNAHNGRVTFVDNFSAMKVNGLDGKDTSRFENFSNMLKSWRISSSKGYVSQREYFV